MSTSTDSRSSGPVLLFAVTIFTSAFLLFQVQPLLAKFILPWFGGTPAVWTMCMLVFQLLLFGGYAYAHLLSGIRSVSRQAMIHAVLLALAAMSLPIVPDAGWKPAGDESPALRITLLLLASAGLPYFLLSSTGPLLQQWFSRACPSVSPYRLYALSNAGSLIALVSYPFLFEPAFSSTSQAWLWSTLFVVFSLTCLLCSWRAALSNTTPDGAEVRTIAPGADIVVRPDSERHMSRWFILAALPSVLLLATTNEVCMDIAVVPFLWIIPLTLYLLSFILTFESDRCYQRRLVTVITALSLVLTSVMMARGGMFGVLVQIVIFFANLFLVCMLCHGELVRLRPEPQRLTAFYLTISAGGAAGGLFVGLVAPCIFNAYCELPLGIFCALLVCAGTWLGNDAQFRKLVPPATTLRFGLGLSSLLLLYFVIFAQKSPSVRAMDRNFYGVLRIEDDREAKTQRPARDMVHGRVVHGRQFLDPRGRSEATTYYSPSSGIGRLLTQTPAGRRIGVVGLGAGTLAVYGRNSDSFRFYEINPSVIDLAKQHFTFLSDCEGQVALVAGDARLVLEREPCQNFDILVLDAFSGDAIPVHLLTSEAMQIYTRHLHPEGVLAVHISNTYFDLEPVVTALAAESGFEARSHACDAGADQGVALDSVWMLLCRSEAQLAHVLGPRSSKNNLRTVLWTDDRNNLLNVLR